MPFLAPVLGAAIGGVAATAIGQAVIGVGLSVAAGYAARAIAPKPQQRGAAGHRLNLRYDPNAPREIGVGLFASAGSLGYRNVYGNQDWTEILHVTSDYTSDGLERVFVAGKEVSWNPATGAVGGYPGMTITVHNGAWDQLADLALVANSTDGRWTTNHRGRGVAYQALRMRYDAALYPSGNPDVLYVLRGARFYDWRKDSSAGGSGPQRWGQPETYTWTRNPAVIAYNWCRGLWLGGQRVAGMNMPAGILPLDRWTAAANACDEQVPLKGGGFETRYCADGLLSTASPHREVLRALATAMAGRFIDTGGLFYPLAGVAEAPVLSITDDDLLRDADIELIDKLSRNQLVNAVFGTYHEPGQQYAPIAAPPRISLADEAADGSRLEQHYPLDLVTSGTCAQRILEILRRECRYQGTGKLPLRARCRGLEAGDVFSWTSARYGYVNKLFRVATTEAALDGSGILATISETAAAIYGWTPALDELDPQAPMVLPSGGAPTNTIEGLQVANVVVTSAGAAQLPGLALTWTPPVDPTVVAIRVAYRRQGDEVALETNIYDPSTGGVFVVTDGVQGGTVYEVAALPVTVPERAGLTWTSWVVPSTATDPQVVDVAAVAITVPDESITPEKLDLQSRMALYMSIAQAETQGSVNERVAKVNDKIVQIAEAVAELQMRTVDTGAFVRRQEIIRQSDTDSLAKQITQVEARLEEDVASAIQQLESTVFNEETGLPSKASASALTALSTVVDGNTNAISEVMEVDSEGNSRWMIAATEDGDVAYFISADGTKTSGAITLGAPMIQFVDPTVSGGVPVHLMTVQTVDRGDGPKARFVLNGEMIADAIRTGSLSAVELTAIFAHLGSGHVDGTLQSVPGNPKGNLKVDFSNIEFRLTTA